MVIEKASTVATYGGSGAAVYFGFTPGEWQVIGIVGGLIFAAAGFAVNLLYKHKHYLLAEKRAGLGDEI
jgi:hypothetical protein